MLKNPHPTLVLFTVPVSDVEHHNYKYRQSAGGICSYGNTVTASETTASENAAHGKGRAQSVRGQGERGRKSHNNDYVKY